MSLIETVVFRGLCLVCIGYLVWQIGFRGM